MAASPKSGEPHEITVLHVRNALWEIQNWISGIQDALSHLPREMVVMHSAESGQQDGLRMKKGCPPPNWCRAKEDDCEDEDSKETA